MSASYKSVLMAFACNERQLTFSRFVVEVKLVGLCRQSEGYAVSRTTTPEAADFKKRKRSCAWLYYWSFFSSLTDWLSSRRLETFPAIYLAHRVRKRYHRHACRRSRPTRRYSDLLIFCACASVILLSRQAQRQQQRPGRRLGLRLPRLHPPHL